MIGKTASEQVTEQIPAIETQRVLLGFFSDEEQAINRLQTADQVENPVDAKKLDELDPDEKEEIEQEKRQEYLEQWEEAKSGLAPLPGPVQAQEVDLQDLPDDDEIQDHISEYTDKQGLQEVVADIPDDSWEFKLVPIESITTVQPHVTTTAYQEIPNWEDDPVGVLEYCFPVDQEALMSIAPYQSPDDSFIGTRIITRSPNFQLSGMEIGDLDDRSGKAVTFVVTPKPNFVQVAQYRGRYILKNGYHRVYQLYDHGETHVPAMVRNVDSWQDTGGNKDGFFVEGLVTGARPPVIPDFNTDVAVDLKKPATSKVIRIMGETATVPR